VTTTRRTKRSAPSAAGDARLLGNRLLAALPAKELERLLPHLEKVALPARAVLFEPGEEVEHAHFPAEGTVISMVGVMEDGRTAELAVIGCEGAAGGLVSAGGKPASARAVTQIGGDALRIDCTRLEKLRHDCPALHDLLTRFSDALLAQVMQSAACNALHPVEARACRRLLEMQDRAGKAELRLTQEHLAETLGVQRSTVARVLGDLDRDGLIRRGRGRLVVANRKRLEARSCECWGAVRGHFECVAPDLYPDAPAKERLAAPA
jgi:CRP-like cAMP-binding protein